jgi:large subunit ribosomal protein L21
MFAVVRTGGKQYRVAPGDKIVVEKLDGNAGDKVTLGDVLLAGEGSSLKSTDGLTVAAEIIAQAKADKVTVFKKRRRHNYRRKKGHRQQHTILKIVAIGDYKEAKKAEPKAETKAVPKAKADAKPAPESKPAADKPAARANETAKVEAAQHEASEVVGTPTENPAPDDDKAAKGKPAAPKKAAPAKAKTPSTKNAAPAKAAAKKTPKAK